MKKLIGVFASFLILFSSAAIAEVDLSSMTTSELRVLQREITNEIISRSVEPEHDFTLTERGDVILIGDDEVALIYTGRINDQSWSGYCMLEMAFYNYSAIPQGIRMKDVYLNGWKLSTSSISSAIGTGERKRCDVTVRYQDAFLSSSRGMEELIFTLTTNDSEYNEIKSYGTYRIKFEPSYWGK